MDTRGSRRIAAVIQYNGSDFDGFQIQNRGRTVQGEIEKALEILFGRKTAVYGSGRTDAGVHALYQVIHFNIFSDMKLNSIARSLNGILLRDVAVKELYDVENTFHSRFNAVEREYTYLIYNSENRCPFFEGRSYWEQSHIDIEYFRKASSYIHGTHDFTSFCKKKSSDVSNIRTINNIVISREENLIKVVITGTSFLHNMIRIIMGTLIKMHRSGADPSEMMKIIQSKDREAAGPTLSACGLYLSRVKYSPDLSDRRQIL